MLPEEICAQSPAIDGIYDRLQQSSKSKGHQLRFLVEWIIQYLVIQVPHEVYETLLLRTGDRFVCGIEIRHKNPSEPLQQLLNSFSFAALGENVHDVREAG